MNSGMTGPDPTVPAGAVALVSAKGSPGVTTSSVLLAAVWPTGSLLLEADPAGGDLRALFTEPTGPPLRPDRGVVSLLTAQAGTPGSVGVSPLTDHSQQLPGGLSVVLGPSNASQVEALRNQWPQLSVGISQYTRAGGHVVLDAGRLSDPSSLALTVPLLRACTTTLVVARGTVTSLTHARDLLALLREVAIPAELLLIADPRDTLDASQALRLSPAQLHVLPDDAATAAAIRGAWTRRLDRSRLLAAARDIAGDLHRRLPTAASAPPTPPEHALGDLTATSGLTSAGSTGPSPTSSPSSMPTSMSAGEVVSA